MAGGNKSNSPKAKKRKLQAEQAQARKRAARRSRPFGQGRPANAGDRSWAPPADVLQQT